MRALGGSLRSRLFRAIALIVVLSVGLTLAVGLVLTRRAVERARLDDVAHQADLLAGRERIALAPLAHVAGLRPFLARQGERVQTPLLGAPTPYLPEPARLALAAGRSARGSVSVDGGDWYFAAEPVGKRAFVLLRPKRLAASDWRPYLEALLIAGLVGATLAAAASLLLARVISRPVRRVAAASRSLAGGERPEPVPLEGADELVVLASAFNDLSAQLARARDAERSFLLSVSHELKTPLTAIRGYAEALRDNATTPGEAGEVIGRDAARLERLVGDLLDLARMSRSEFGIRPAEMDLAEAAGEAVRRYEPQAAAFGVGLELHVSGPAHAVADADRVLQIVSNLVENALRVTPPHGSVRVTVAPGTICVEDTGPGLEAEDLAHAFDRFYLWSRYGRERRVGTGLGLAIVKELADAMGGRVEVESESGRGARFVVSLPVPESPRAARRAGAAAPAQTSR